MATLFLPFPMRRIPLKLILILAGTLVGLTLGEVIVRAFRLGHTRTVFEYNNNLTKLKPHAGFMNYLENTNWVEINNLGFNVYRQINGQRVKINPSLIAGSALMLGSDVRLESGYTYSWQDDVVDRTASYWLEDVDLNGSSTWHGPFGISSSSITKVTRTRSPLLLPKWCPAAARPLF